MVASRNAAPRIAPTICAMIFTNICIGEIALTKARPKETAGFSCPPDRWEVAYARTVMAKPKARAVVIPQDELILTVDANSWNDSAVNVSPLPLSLKFGASLVYPVCVFELNVVAVPAQRCEPVHRHRMRIFLIVMLYVHHTHIPHPI